MKFLNLLVLISIYTIFTGCDKPLEQLDPKAIEDSFEELQSGFKYSKEELMKLRQVDYKVVSLDKAQSDEQLAATLSQLGKDRWNCFEVVYINDELKVFCSRPTETPLRYIPSSLRHSISGNL